MCTISSFSQNNSIADTANRWYIAQADMSSRDKINYYYLKLQGDFVINNKHYFGITKIFIDPKDNDTMRMGYLREDTLRNVYYIPTNSVNEYLIYAFPQKQGVKFNIFDKWYYGINTSNIYLQEVNITAIDSILTEIGYRKRYTVKRTCKSSGKNIWIDGIGSVNGLLESKIHSSCIVNGVIAVSIGGIPSHLAAFTRRSILEYIDPHYIEIKNKLIKYK